MPSEPVVYPEVIVPTARIIEREPDTIRTFVDRIVTVEVEPTQVAVAPGGATEQVQQFCKPLVVAHTDTVESGATVDPMLLLRSVSYDRKWAWRKDHLLLTGPTNEGDLRALDFDVRGDFTARTVGENVLVQYPRGSLIYDVWEGGSQVYTAYKIIENIIEVLN